MCTQNRFKALVGLLVIAAMVPAYGAVWYVTPDGSGDGASWDTAGALQAVVNAAAANDEVWVAAGAYTATTDTVLNMKASVHLYGGFTGTEIAVEQRDWETNVTVIDGEETRRCVIGADGVLDGFTVTNGYAEYGGSASSL